MKPLDNEKNLTFMNNPRRVAAQKELDGIVRHINADLKTGGDAQYLLAVLLPLLKRLKTAYESLVTIEVQIINELENKTE